MSHVYITVDLGDEVRAKHSKHTDEYIVTLGAGALVSLPPSKAAELRDALIAALADPEETPNGH